ncbi:MAG: sigma 54-interacting transcriptional regulator [Kofleriaceae bacterium]|nr:sigma 54-interacting transcriptional regulator [Kofleriaceae bacterium]MCB9571397.1 sigma 54-interacting transcriptional regulator [Kofleriaceae bacterium]
MRAADLDLVELLDFVPAEGRISLRDQRMLLWDADAFGNLRRELIDNLGLDAARGILRRFGFANGYRDALTTREMFSFPSDAEWWLTCPALQGHEGKVKAQVQRLEVDRPRGHFLLEVHWDNSYEAAQHLRVKGPADGTACWTLAGYASGFASAVMGEEVFVVEQTCAAAGASPCRVVGRTRREWGAQAERIAAEYKAPALAQELEAREEELRRTSRRLQRRERELRRLRGEDDVQDPDLTRNPRMHKVYELVAKVAQVDATVLISGESGVGKERIARMLHDRSPRARGELIAINCGALPEPLLESELFGHVRGAFTGATTDKKGLFEAARGGTIFLDEIGEMSGATQVKLLRVLQEREVRPVGATASVPVDVRVVAATHRNLADMVAAGEFRHDLYYRLKVISVDVPPLRQRKEDVLPLARQFVIKTCARYRIATKTLSAAAAAAINAHDWPGNVRELEHAIEHAVVMAGDAAKISPEHLPAELEPGGATSTARLLDETLTLEELERRYTLMVLERHRGSRSATAKALHIGTNTLWRKLKRWGVQPALD